MEKIILKKILSIFMIIVIMSANFYVLGANLISYAVDSGDSTNNKNIEFSAYFKNSNGEKVNTLSTSINSENLKLYVEITVKNDGYFNGKIELQNNNFNFKNSIISKWVEKIEGNTATLKQINAGATATIELDIEPIIVDTMESDMLVKASDVKLTGKYMETSYKGLEIEGTKSVDLQLLANENAEAELTTEIITNKVFNIDETNKRVVQVLVKSRLKDNQYPIKQTIINVTEPKLSDKLPEKVEVLSLGTMATNEKTTLTDSEWENKDGNVVITLKNEDETISWNKNGYDELVVTFIYEENVDANKVEVVTNSEITLYNSNTKFTAKYTKGIENQEPNGIVTEQVQMSSIEGLYKGQIASNIEAQYNKEAELVITSANIVEKVVIEEPSDVLTTQSGELTVNTKYISTEINKNQMLELLGQEGSIEIKNGQTTTVINKDTETDENGNIIIKYENSDSKITITTSKPIKAGVLKFKHIKAITMNTFNSTQLKTINSIKTISTVKGIDLLNETEQTVVENTSESSIDIKDTISKAEFTINKEALSTMTTNKNVVLGVKLITDGVQYDLYKNPTIKIKLPSSVESINMNGEPSSLYADDFTVNTQYDNTNKEIIITLKGEQKAHPETSATQLYLQLDVDMTLSKLEPSKKDKFIMIYTNENATKYDGGTNDQGIVEKEIEISSPSGLVAMYNSSTYNISGINGIDDENQLIQIKDEEASKNVNFEIALINNTGLNATNVRIFGKLPTEGNKVVEQANSLLTTLINVSASNATIYYSKNASATSDIQETSNEWSTTLLPDAKVFLIKVDELNAQSNFTASYTTQLPSSLSKDTISYSQYKVIYDTENEKNAETESVTIGFATPTEIKLETGITAQVGNDTIKNEDKIKAGEVIRYTMTVKNNGAQEIKNVKLTSNVPDRTVLVEPEENYQHSGISYYTEKTDIKEISETIASLEAGATYTKTYEVRVKSDLSIETAITNKTVAVCGDSIVESSELKNTIVPSNIRVTIKKLVQDDMNLVSGGTMEYMAFVENISDQDISNLQMQIISTNFQITHLSDGNDLYLTGDSIPEIINIENIPANGNVFFKIEGNTIENSETVDAIAIVKDNGGNTFRSNKCIDSLDKVDAKISLSSPQDKAYIREGDIIEYNITVENTGNISENIEIVDNVPEYLEIQTLYVNDTIVLQKTETAKTDTYISNISNNVSYKINVSAGEKATMTIISKVKNVTEDIDAKTITNKAEAKVYQMTKSTSEEVTHILKVTAADVKNIINGKAWLDKNINGAKDSDETLLSGITVRLYNVEKNDYEKDENGSILETKTNENGEYSFTKIPNGKYIVLFEYDTNEYEPTFYQKEGVDDSRNSKVIAKNITINGQDKLYAVTDIIDLQDNISNINIGLKEKLIFDLELDKYISKVSVQTKSGTKTYDYQDETLAKAEIKSKEISGAVVVLEYTIKVKNNGEIAGYVNNIVDYLSNGLTFSSELNPDWYISGENLYTKKLANDPINPGETKEVKLILTKTMTNNNTGVVNNRAEIYDAYNEYGNLDINSTPNNNVSSENDMGAADVIIGISTGGTIAAYIILVIINTILIVIAIRLMIKNKIINIKKERG